MSSISSTVDGLVSGLNTTSIINSLVSADAATQTRLKSTVSTAQLKVAGYQSVNTKMTALQTAAEALQKATAWSPVKATSSNEAVTVTTDSKAGSGSLTVNVVKLASARTAVSEEFALTDGKVDPSTLSYPLDVVKSDGSYVTLKPNTGTLDQVAAAINEAGQFGIKAVAIRVSDNKYRLQITSTDSGSKGDFKLVPHTGSGRPEGTVATPGKITFAPGDYAALSTVEKAQGIDELSPAQDAEITIGKTNPITVTSSSNSFKDVMPGVSLAVTKEASSVTVGVTSNPEAIASAMQSLVDAANAALSDITLQTRPGAVGADGKVTGGGTLKGDSALRALKAQIVDAVTSAVGGNSSAATFGLQIDKTKATTSNIGLSFDKAKFLEAHAKDPVGVQALVSGASLPAPKVGEPARPDGIVERIARVAKSATDSVTGTITSAISGQNSSIGDLTKRIADWDTRLADKRAYYQKYYGALEVALGKLQSQSTWMAGQLAGLG
ncbi:flagellar filament capping protein FliD [Kineococcus sp. SYSU DK002]|uniref:flagellar filament capping protein FliD n=1 Tax=Kineococcus sp. SYSU DK002 TaxID=3383123 RepID=UPI003D7D83F3